MPALDLDYELPEEWQALDNPDGPLTLSPDDGGSVLQISSPSWLSQLREAPLDEHVGLLKRILEEGKLGRMLAAGRVELPYGPALRAEVDGESEILAWLVVPPIHDALLVTWIPGSETYTDSAVELVASLRPGLFSHAIASAVEISSQALATDDLSPHAVLFGNGLITQLQLASLPQEVWNDACRFERARAGAEVIVQVLPATANQTTDVAIIYAESSTRQRRLVVGDGPTAHELGAEDRIDLFAACDPRVAQALEAART